MDLQDFYTTFFRTSTSTFNRIYSNNNISTPSQLVSSHIPSTTHNSTIHNTMAPRREMSHEELATFAPALYSNIHKKSPTKSAPRKRRTTRCTRPAANTEPGYLGEGGYAIDQILDARPNPDEEDLDQKWEYLVTYTGWPVTDTAWYTHYHIGTQADALIEAYWSEQNDDFEYRKAQAMRSPGYLESVKGAYKFSKNMTTLSTFVALDKAKKERANEA